MPSPKPFVPILENDPTLNSDSLRRRPPKRASSAPRNSLFLLLTSDQWLIAFAVGMALALILWPFYRQVSPWVGVALLVVGVTLCHLRYAAWFIVPFPHIALLIAALQYVLAAWASAYWPAADPMYDIGTRLPQYLRFATLVLLGCAAAWGLGLAKMRVPDRRPTVIPAPDLLFALDVLLVLGFLGVVPARLTQGTSFGFVFILMANLRYVGVFGRMVLLAPGWGWRLALVVVVELVFSTGSGMFHGFILFGFWAFALGAYVFRISWRGLMAACFAALLLLPALQASKWELRDNTWSEGTEGNVETRSALEKTTFWSSYMLKNFKKTLTWDLDTDFLSGTVARYNQGWIVNRVMQQVPSVEPYARGETLKDAFISVLVPRVFYPDKVITGGKVNMERFAGITLTQETSMNLGYAGEMYANFGYWDGIIGCGCYCLFFALLFRAICIRAFVAPLWWAVLPYIVFVAFKAEDDIVGVVNWIAKACVVMVAICFAFPAFRRALFPAKQRKRTARKPLSEDNAVESEATSRPDSNFARSGGNHPDAFRPRPRN